MPRQLLGKRSRSSSTSSPSPATTLAYRTRRSTRIPPSPEPIPNPKRIKTFTTEFELDDGSNKENIPPEPRFSSLTPPNALTDSPTHPSQETTSTPRSMRASRRAATLNAFSIPVPHRRVSVSRSRSDASLDCSAQSPPVSRSNKQKQIVTGTPPKSMASLSLVTPPTTPETFSPFFSQSELNDKPTPLYMQARALLRPQTEELSPLIGREHEKAHILDFLVPFLSDQAQLDSPTSLYISGAPGTGKTALVNETLAKISANRAVDVVYVNCLALGSKDGLTGVWERCAEELTAEKDTKCGVVTPKLDWGRRFAKLFENRKNRKCVLVLDEIDHLVTSASTSATVSQVFAIASTSRTSTALRIIGISNTHTLSHSQPIPNTLTLHFEPYTAAQMKAVVIARLASLDSVTPKLFPIPTITLLAMKVANQTGDIRTLLSVARRALDLAVTSSTSHSHLTVMPAHILAALKVSNASIRASQGKNGAETVTRVRNLGLQARFALTALLLATRRLRSELALTNSNSHISPRKSKENIQNLSSARSSISLIDVTALHGFYTTILSRGADIAFAGLGRTEFSDLIGLLEGSGLVELSHGRGFGVQTKSLMKGKGVQVVCIASAVREEELIRGLVGSSSNSTENADVKEEEVRRIWEKENARISREIKAKIQDGSINKAGFEGAEED